MYEIFNRLKKNPALFTKIIIASFFVNILALATPIYVIQVLQRYVAYGVSSTLVTLVAGITLVVIFEFFFRNIRHRMTRETEAENTVLADRVMKKIVSIKSNFYALQKNLRPDIVTQNLQTIKSNLNATTTLILIDVPFVLIFLIALFLIHYQLGIITTLFLAIPFIVINFYRKKINDLNQQSLQIGLNTARLHDNSSSRFESIKYFNLIEMVKTAWSSLVKKSMNVTEDLEAQKNIVASFMTSSSALLTVIIIAWGAVLAVDGEISVGALIGANILAARALAPIVRFVQNIEPLHKANHAINELAQFLNLPQDSLDGNQINDYSGKLQISDLQFKYPESKIPIFEGLNIETKAGELLVINGSNGSGKSTLIKSIIRLLEFNRGQIFYDSIEINQLSLDWVRANLIYLPQEPKFVDGTMLNNLLGQNQIKKDKMTEILRSVDLLDFINSDPKGIDMPLTNRGEDLPFGIRKRIALARALVIGGKLVVLDEPTESIDDRGRKSIYKLINDLLKNKKTLIIATQDEKILNIADCIVNLDVKPIPKIIKRK